MNPSQKCSQERLARGTVTSAMCRAAHPSGCARCGAGAGCSSKLYARLQGHLFYEKLQGYLSHKIPGVPLSQEIAPTPGELEHEREQSQQERALRVSLEKQVTGLFPHKIRRGAIANVNFSNFRGNIRQKWTFQDVEYPSGTQRPGLVFAIASRKI